MAIKPVRTSIAVAICTYERNEALELLLRSLIACAARIADRAAVGVVVVDDTAHGGARPVAEAFRDRFELGLAYRISGRRNISLARNLAIETAAEMAEWTAMTDDDCEPVPEWLEALLNVQRRTDADAVTGIMVRRAPEGSPRWIIEEPFLDLGADQAADGEAMPMAYTNNSMISSDWLKRHPDVRFDPSLGTIGGEDMVFFRTARQAGLRIHFSKRGFVYENEPPSRITLGYQLRRFYWHGNSSYVSSVESGVAPARMLVHGMSSMARAVVRPVSRMIRGQKPQLRYAAASILKSIGILTGTIGIRVRHH